MRCDALIACPLNGMDAVKAANGAAAGVRHPFIARSIDVVEVITARALIEIAAVGCSVSQLGAGSGQDGTREYGVTALDACVVGRVGVSDKAAQA